MSDESLGHVLRTCTECGVSKPSNRFLQTGVPGEYHAVCKACESIQQAEQHKDTPRPILPHSASVTHRLHARDGLDHGRLAVRHVADRACVRVWVASVS